MLLNEFIAVRGILKVKKMKSFEKSFAHYCNTKYCVGVGNGLDALYLSLKALGIKGREMR